MKVNVEVECTPEEARAFLGLPNVEPLNDHLVSEMKRRMDEVIFEEFKGTGNSEIVLDRKVADKRIFPAIDVLKSGTRKEELTTPKDQLAKTYVLRRILNPMGPQDAIEFLIDKLRQSKNNADFFQSMNT